MTEEKEVLLLFMRLFSFRKTGVREALCISKNNPEL